MSHSLTLPAELTIYAVTELREQCLAWLHASQGDPDAGVDGAAVDEVDGAGLQLLLSLAQTLAREQRPLQLLRPSAQLRAACEALGLQSLLAAHVSHATELSA